MPSIITPNYDRAIFRLLPTIFQECFKKELPDGYDWVFKDKKIKSRFEECDHAVILLIDALGAKNLYGDFFITKLFNEYGFEASSVFPTLTANACASIYLGLPPEESGVIAQRFFVKEIGAYLDALRGRVVKSDVPLSRAGVNLEAFLWKKGIANFFDALVIDLLPKTIPSAGLADFYPNVVRMSWENHVDLIYFSKKVIDWLKDKVPSILFIYIPDIDTIGHIYSPESSAFRLQLAQLDNVIQNLIKVLKNVERRIMLFVISDHGMTKITEAFITNEESHKKLEEIGVDVIISGRFAFIYKKKEDVDIGKIEELVQNRAKIFPIEELTKKKLWPALSRRNREKFLERAGDYILIPEDNVDIYIGARKVVSIEDEIRGYNMGSHGGATEEEIKAILIPINLREINLQI